MALSSDDEFRQVSSYASHAPSTDRHNVLNVFWSITPSIMLKICFTSSTMSAASCLCLSHSVVFVFVAHLMRLDTLYTYDTMYIMCTVYVLHGDNILWYSRHKLSDCLAVHLPEILASCEFCRRIPFRKTGSHTMCVLGERFAFGLGSRLGFGFRYSWR